ncbi:hypothetical protein H8356DRAFT_959427 [Neocallimastix lanati (nom. inval.)]|uniref:Uncharacterized protein n=1 Tax=Neocallimastix californiae TaxID=1754190 RepID=A0A1Y2AC19_9FUNG|nr:hypothetical protein H8356DRAFT_959427 [Neocallimastix sp. JGI-2020a]ORY20024.1 hypothetical protein LY90DRAFT_517137 [Neocallimastix californiae]|eukprot:ORY20024.1 hypothetical protein LY90DRAFT_517137 [Neocallimastix californiae]
MPHDLTEKLDQLHPSILSNPSIRKEKKIEQEFKDNDRRLKNPLDQEINPKPKVKRHIQLVEGKKNYNIKDKLNSFVSQITLGQLLDISPKVRNELKPSVTIVNNIDLVKFGKQLRIVLTAMVILFSFLSI